LFHCEISRISRGETPSCNINNRTRKKQTFLYPSCVATESPKSLCCTYIYVGLPVRFKGCRLLLRCPVSGPTQPCSPFRRPTLLAAWQQEVLPPEDSCHPSRWGNLWASPATSTGLSVPHASTYQTTHTACPVYLQGLISRRPWLPSNKCLTRREKE
jgi:hypothetical protein